MGLVVAVFALVVLFGAYFLGRFTVARASGVRGARAALGLRDEAWEGISLGRRVGTSVGGFVGYYLGVASLVAMGIMISGQTVVDEASMRVTVSEDGPASRAGMRAGDRIISVGSVPTPDWTSLKLEVGKHPGEATAVLVERAGVELPLMVTPDGEGMNRGRMKVGPLVERKEVSLGTALGRGLVEPFRVLAAMGKSLGRMFSGTDPPELSGPVGIVRETSRAANSAVGDGLRLVGALAAYSFYVALIVSALTVPRSRRKKA